MKTSIRATLAIAMFSIMSIASYAQVESIKGASSSNSKKEGGGSRSGSSSGGGNLGWFVGEMIFRGLGAWQVNTLQHRGEVPNVLSLEVFGQASLQPGRYYVFNPRIRGNWGILFSDFRMNYMVEDNLDGVADLRTDDWQVLGFNLVNTRQVTARLSTGIMHEAFGDGNSFNESVFGLSIMSPSQSFGGGGEFRWATDWSTGAMPRVEASLNVQKKLFDRRAMHVFVLGGVQFQRYYGDIDVWGMQAGLAFKLY